MIIHSITLENIRSYEHSTIDFDKGITLLCGDIGSGKTTVLLALEYAVFGILRGKMSPQELLRHGAKEGNVTVHLSVEGKDIIIKRGLKRSGKTIVQTEGVLRVNGEEEILVATELKAKLLGILGYPESLINRSTNLFRYTVYTPQEQVKTILHETTEERKDIVRKIFGIDKYKTVQENTAHYVSDVRERTQRLQGQIDDVKTLQQQYEAAQKEITLLKSQLPKQEEALATAKKKTTEAKTTYETIQKQEQEQQKLQYQFKLKEQELLANKELLSSYKQQLKEIITELAKELKTVSVDKEKLQKVKDSLVQVEEKKAILQQKFGSITAGRTQSQELIANIDKLTICPTCKQEVDANHKAHIIEDENKKMQQLQEREVKLKGIQVELLAKETKIKSLQEQLTKQQQEFMLYEQELARRKLQQEKQSKLQEQYNTLQEKQTKLEEELAKVPKPQEKKEQGKEKLVYEEAQRLEREAELQAQQTKTRLDVATKTLTQLATTIKEKEQIKQSITNLSTIRNWVQELFVPLTRTIEKRVLLKIYNEFNSYFVQWFDQLVADDHLQVRLDEDFAPLVMQNGYDTTIANLSGGEKTAVALSYRLALNKVLNDYFSMLNTKGLLILDEPTDGFSAEQLDKLREVLIDLGVEQLILVSHEQRIESLAEHIIRVEKHQQVSTIL